MRIGKSGWVLLAVLAVLAWHYAPHALNVVSPSFVESTQDRGVYYRLLAKYQHGDEIVDFDIVVGCGVTVTRYGDGGSSYDAFRDPVVFAKRLRDGSALMQIVPSACFGETTDNGKVPHDFLPGAIRFEHADNLSLGIAYVTEDAFESVKSKLKFLGASIHVATRKEWEAFKPMAAENLIDPRPLFSIMPMPDPVVLRQNLGDSRALTTLWPGMSCHVVTRLHMGETARAIIREYWPASKPRFWTPSQQQLDAIDRRVNLFSDADSDPSTRYLAMGHHTAIGFPTRARGGAIGSSHREWDLLPPTIFPLRRDEGIPWVTPSTLIDSTLYRDVEFDSGANRGLGYCYRRIPPSVLGNTRNAPYFRFTSRVDGLTILGEEIDPRQARDRPWPFFEADEYLYFAETFGLN